MSDPVLHLLAGPNGAGKSTLYSAVLKDVLRLEFVNADVIAEERWPGQEVESAMKASSAAAQRREELLETRTSFVTETVFSHHSKVELIKKAQSLGYVVTLYVVAVPIELAVVRVAARLDTGGHDVPVQKIRQRWHRLWPLVGEALSIADEAKVYDNSDATRPYRLIARVHQGCAIETGAPWPGWLPLELADADAN